MCSAGTASAIARSPARSRMRSSSPRCGGRGTSCCSATRPRRASPGRRRRCPARSIKPGTGFEPRPSLRTSFAELSGVAATIGHNIAPKDADGVTRAMSPFIDVGGVPVPSLGTAAALIAERQPADAVRLEPDALRIGGVRMPLIRVAVPAAAGQPALVSRRAVLRYRGPYAEGDASTYPIYSFFDVLLSEEEVTGGRKPPIDPSVFRDKIVIVGTRAAGAYDVHKTAFNASTPGLHMHATLADNILSNQFMTRASASRRSRGGARDGTGRRPARRASARRLGYGRRRPRRSRASRRGSRSRSQTAPGWDSSSRCRRPVSRSSAASRGGTSSRVPRSGGSRGCSDATSRRTCSSSCSTTRRLAQLGGRRREMTVLFSDIRGFTAASEKGTPEAVVLQLNEYFNEMVDVLFRHHGTLDKFVGDMVMGLFGAPVEDPRHADHAVAAAPGNDGGPRAFERQMAGRGPAHDGHRDRHQLR